MRKFCIFSHGCIICNSYSTVLNIQSSRESVQIFFIYTNYTFNRVLSIMTFLIDSLSKLFVKQKQEFLNDLEPLFVMQANVNLPDIQHTNMHNVHSKYNKSLHFLCKIVPCALKENPHTQHQCDLLNRMLDQPNSKTINLTSHAHQTFV